MIKRLLHSLFFYLSIAAVIIGIFASYMYGSLLALLFFCAGAAGLYLDFKRVSRLYKEEHEKLIESFKQRAVKYRIKFDQCEIKTNNYSEERLKDSHFRAERDWNAASRKTEYVDILQSVIIVRLEISGMEKIFYSPIIDKDRDTIEVKLAMAKYFNLYIDPENTDSYYFDLEYTGVYS